MSSLSLKGFAAFRANTLFVDNADAGLITAQHPVFEVEGIAVGGRLDLGPFSVHRGQGLAAITAKNSIGRILTLTGFAFKTFVFMTTSRTFQHLGISLANRICTCLVSVHKWSFFPISLSGLAPDFAVIFYCGAALLAATLVSRFRASTYLVIRLRSKIGPTSCFAKHCDASLRTRPQNQGLKIILGI
jgi:hypothetical protein